MNSGARRSSVRLGSPAERAPTKLVVYPAVSAVVLSRIEDHLGGGSAVNCATSADALEAVRDADCFFGLVTPEILAAAQRLEWIQAPTTGLDRYLFSELVNHPAVLTNMKGWNAAPIADQVMTYVLSFAKNLHLYVRQQLEHRWAPIRAGGAGGDEAELGQQSPEDRAVIDLQGSVLGIIGLGEIGRETARRAVAFGMDVVAASRRQTDRPTTVRALWDMDNLDRVLSAADFLVIAAPLTSATAGLIGLPELETMKRGAYLINVGRGPIVKLDDLTLALNRQLIAGAALDVVEQEPLPPSHPLWKRTNVIITPHVAGYSPRVAGRRLDILLENIDRRVGGLPLLNIVDKHAAS